MDGPHPRTNSVAFKPVAGGDLLWLTNTGGTVAFTNAPGLGPGAGQGFFRVKLLP